MNPSTIPKDRDLPSTVILSEQRHHRRALCPAAPPCTWLEHTAASPSSRPNPRTPLGLLDAIAPLALPCCCQRQQSHYRAPPLCHHCRRRGSFGEPLSQPRAPVDVGYRVGHDGEDATVCELWPARAVLCSCVADGRDPLTYGPLLLVAVGALDRVHLAAELDLKFDFLYLLFQIL